MKPRKGTLPWNVVCLAKRAPRAAGRHQPRGAESARGGLYPNLRPVRPEDLSRLVRPHAPQDRSVIQEYRWGPACPLACAHASSASPAARLGSTVDARNEPPVALGNQRRSHRAAQPSTLSLICKFLQSVSAMAMRAARWRRIELRSHIVTTCPFVSHFPILVASRTRARASVDGHVPSRRAYPTAAGARHRCRSSHCLSRQRMDQEVVQRHLALRTSTRPNPAPALEFSVEHAGNRRKGRGLARPRC